MSDTQNARPHHERIYLARRELQNITDILSRLTATGEDPVESCVQWFIPKLDAVSTALDNIEAEMVQAAEGFTT